ncbi:hypothetical protein POM88_028213 [Heracleum sosnowskyi]|uniref:Uncharacterized protein n=1 Tax=Heracleum sosnowskyi TaxID=360622 RepID=A0AAD8MQW5_9APIA|nr:hypothetical protein POM88_028213 [Heracleum sosnowskyi]
MVGMQTVEPSKEYEVMIGEKMSGAVKDKIKQLDDKFKVKKNEMDHLTLAVEMKKLDLNIKNDTVGLGNLRYGLNDVVRFRLSYLGLMVVNALILQIEACGGQALTFGVDAQKKKQI